MAGRKIETRISPDILDTIGKSFKFSHGKGIAEWLKNSLDQYLRLSERGTESTNGERPVIINLIDGKNQKMGPNLAVLDFGGTTHNNIVKFFLHWGDKSAATHGKKIADLSVTGGHGNGGKFYMREMWRDGARFATLRNGKATSVIVKKMDDGNTGEYEYENEDIEWREVLRRALSKDDNLGGGMQLLVI